MGTGENNQPRLREQAAQILSRLSPAEREALLVKCWMSHDARWYMAVAAEYGLEAAGRLNASAARETGKAETRRLARALQLPPVRSVDDYMLAQEVIIGLLGPDLLEYRSVRAGDSACRVEVERCFAHENAARAGIAGEYDCGIFARVMGWLDALDLEYTLEPPPGRCMKAAGADCAYAINLSLPATSPG